VRNNPNLFILREANSGKLQIKSSATLDLPLIETEKPRPSKQRNRRGFGTKNWVGFPILPYHSANALRDASLLLGRKLKSPHFSLGWCKTETSFYNLSCQNMDDIIRKICSQMAFDFILTYSHLSILGKYKDKVTVVFKPVSIKDGQPNETLFAKYSNDILNMWRDAGKNYAKLKDGRFKSFFE